MHAGDTRRSADGVVGRLMRRLLQLRTSQKHGANQPEHARVSGEAKAVARTAAVRFRDPQIEMAHGAGGKASRRLVEGLFAPLLFGSLRGLLNDAAHVSINGSHLAVTTDSFVVKPLTFPGGSIGELAVSGAMAEFMVVTFVLEAGLPTEILQTQIQAMADAAQEARVRIVGGDTKGVEQ